MQLILARLGSQWFVLGLVSVASASRFVGHLAFLRGKVQELEEYALVWGRAKREESTEDTKIVEAAALKAGVEERRVRLAESQGTQVAQVVQRVLNGLGLSQTRLELVPAVVPADLRSIAS